MQASKRRVFGILGLTLALGVGNLACKDAHAKTKGAGDQLRAFIIKNCADGDRYCQVCAYSGKPTIMAVADLDDASVEKDLVQIQGLVEKYGDKGLTAFALFGKIEGGKFIPASDEDAAVAKLAALRERLKLTYPVTIVPKSYTESEKKGYTPFVDAYDITQSRTVMFAAANNKVLWSEVMKGDEAQYAKLASSVEKAL